MSEQTHESEALILLAQSGDRAAMDRLVRDNLALVKFLLKRVLRGGHDFEDLYQFGCIGLMKAIMRFDPSYQVRFSTYAVPVILGEMRRYLRDDAPVRVARSIRDTARKIAAYREARMQDGDDKAPSIDEIAGAVGIPREDVVLALGANLPPRSLSEPIGDGSLTLADTIGTDATAAMEERVLAEQLLDHLPQREREILRMRYYGGQTQTQVAQAFGMTQVQVSRLESKLLRKLREIAG